MKPYDFTAQDLQEGIHIRPLADARCLDPRPVFDVEALDRDENSEGYAVALAKEWVALVRRQQFFVRLAALFDSNPLLETVTLAGRAKTDSRSLLKMTTFSLSAEASERDWKKVDKALSSIRARTGGASNEVYFDIVRHLPVQEDTVMRRDTRQDVVRRGLGPRVCALHDAAAQAQALSAVTTARSPGRRRG